MNGRKLIGALCLELGIEWALPERDKPYFLVRGAPASTYILDEALRLETAGLDSKRLHAGIVIKPSSVIAGNAPGLKVDNGLLFMVHGYERDGFLSAGVLPGECRSGEQQKRECERVPHGGILA